MDEVPGSSVVKVSVSGAKNALSMIQRSWVRTHLKSYSECVVLLSKSVLNQKHEMPVLQFIRVPIHAHPRSQGQCGSLILS